MTAWRKTLITFFLLAIFGVVYGPMVGADDIPEVFTYTFDDVDPIKIYAGPVTFNHAGHVKDQGYPCAGCHHTLAPEETEIDGHCSDCHTEPGFIRGKNAAGKDQDELMEHYLNALHKQCIDCHKELKIQDRKRQIPIGCTQCHIRAKLPLPK